MPWTCGSCQVDLTDDVSSCPECGSSKTSWTIVADVTRTLTIGGGRRGMQVLRGVVGQSLPADDPGNQGFLTEKACVCPVLRKAELIALSEKGHLPGTAHRLVTRVRPKADERTVALVVEFSQDEEGEVEVEGAAELKDGTFDVQFLCVAGTEDVSGITLEGIEIVDVSEDSDAGFAPSVEVTAAKRSVDLPTEMVAQPAVGVLEVEDICFATAREIMFPGGWSLADGITGLSVVAGAMEFARKHPQSRMLIAGHTDPRGSVEANMVLSSDRAKNVHLYLTGQKEAWAAHCQEHFEVADVQSLLKWADYMFQWDCDPGAVDGVWGNGSAKARDAFRARYNEEHGGSLEAGAKQSEADWCAFFDLYDAELAEKLKTDVPRLNTLRGQLAFCEEPTLPCSEHWPTERPGAPDSDAANRRVDVLFFDADEQPALPGEPAGEPIYGEGKFSRDYMTVEDAFREPEPPYGDAPFAEVCTFSARHP